MWSDPVFEIIPNGMRVVVEVGTYEGAWTRRLIDVVPGRYVVNCVDSWEGKHARRRAKFDAVLAPEIKSGKVLVHAGRSLDVAPLFDTVNIDFLFIDGDHLDVYRDLCAWVPRVRPGGLVVLHDYAGHSQSHAVHSDLLKYFSGVESWSAGPVVGRSAGAAGRIWSAWFHKT